MAVKTYSTDFPTVENPLSESGQWINGAVTGLDWSNCRVGTSGKGIGDQTGASFTDGTAVLTGTWYPDQQAQGTVFVTTAGADACAQECEVRLRTTISAHSITGYEIACRVNPNSTAYLLIVRWNGPVGNFTELVHLTGAQYGLSTGDILKGTIVGNTITAYLNGVQIGQTTDSTYASGAPGIGFNLENGPGGCSGTNPNYGFTHFEATELYGFIEAAGSSHASGSTATSIPVTLTNPIRVGDAVGFVAAWDNSGGQTSTTASDGSANVYVKQDTASDAGNTQKAETWVCASATVAVTGTPTVQLNLSATAVSRSIHVYHCSSANAFSVDKHVGQFQAAPGTGANAVTSGSVTTVGADRVVGFVVDSGALRANNFTAGTGFVIQSQTGSASVLNVACEDLVQGGGGSVAATWTQANNDNAIAFVVALFSGGGAAAVKAKKMRTRIGTKLGSKQLVS